MYRKIHDAYAYHLRTPDHKIAGMTTSSDHRCAVVSQIHAPIIAAVESLPVVERSLVKLCYCPEQFTGTSDINRVTKYIAMVYMTYLAINKIKGNRKIVLSRISETMLEDFIKRSRDMDSKERLRDTRKKLASQGVSLKNYAHWRHSIDEYTNIYTALLTKACTSVKDSTGG